MAEKRKKNIVTNKRKTNTYIRLFFSGAAGTGLFFLLISLLSVIALKIDFFDNLFMPCGLFLGFLSGFLSGYTSVMPFKEKALISGSVGGLICVILCGTVAFAVNGGKAGIGLIILCSVIFVSSIIGGVVAAGKKQKRKR